MKSLSPTCRRALSPPLRFPLTTAAAMLIFALFIAARQSASAEGQPGTGFSDTRSAALGRSAAQALRAKKSYRQDFSLYRHKTGC